MRAAAVPSGDDSPAEIWARMRPALQARIGTDACRNWIEPLVYLGAERGVGRFAAPTGFIGTWVSRNYGEPIRQLLMQEGQAISRLEFGVVRGVGRAGAPAARTRPSAPRRPSDRWSSR